mgnify:CR=1 FL=1
MISDPYRIALLRGFADFSSPRIAPIMTLESGTIDFMQADIISLVPFLILELCQNNMDGIVFHLFF